MLSHDIILLLKAIHDFKNSYLEPQTPYPASKIPLGTWPFFTSATSALPILPLTHSVQAHWSPRGPQTHRDTPTSGPWRCCSLCLEHLSPKKLTSALSSERVFADPPTGLYILRLSELIEPCYRTHHRYNYIFVTI